MNGSWMSREVHVQFWERVGVQLPCATHLPLYAAPGIMQSISRPASRRDAAWKTFEGWSPRRWPKNGLDKTAAQRVAYVY